MKKIVMCAVVCALVLTGCRSEKAIIVEHNYDEINKQKDVKDQVKAQLNANDLSSVVSIDNIHGIKEFLGETASNNMIYGNNLPLNVLENYELHKLDFTNDGIEDLAIVTWDKDNPYNQVIFITIDTKGQYKLINSDFRSGPGCLFTMDGSFLYKDDPDHKSYDIAYFDHEAYVKSAVRYMPYGDGDYVINKFLNNKRVTTNSFNKSNGNKRLMIESEAFYIDELGVEHKTMTRTTHFTFNEATLEYDISHSKEINSFEEVPVEAMFLVIGENSNLSSFMQAYGKVDLVSAIDYYVTNRQDFSKESRVKFIEDVHDFIEQSRKDVIEEGKELPQRINNIFSKAKLFFLADGYFSYGFVVEDFYEELICFVPEYTEKLELLAYDYALLMGKDGDYSDRGDDYVDVVYRDIDQAVKEANERVYPKILIQDIDQLESFKGEDIWKTTVMLLID